MNLALERCLATHYPLLISASCAFASCAPVRCLERVQQTARGDYTCACMSPKGRWVYCVGEDGEMLCFDAATAELERTLKVSEKEVIGLAHHPHR